MEFMAKRMKGALRALAALIALCMLWAASIALSAPALAQTRAYIYGGSADDALGSITASEDGRIVMAGYTNSTDGTLASRTKTGRSGWALCVDAQGEVLWSFCTRLGDHDVLTAPLFHEDGSVTLILEAEVLASGEQEIELIRLDRAGEVVFRKTLMRTGGDMAYIDYAYSTDEGYIVSWSDKQARSLASALFDWDANRVREMGPMPDSRVFARSEGHVLRESGNMKVLFAVDARGDETTLDAEELPVNTITATDISSLITLPDGGAAGVGTANNTDDYAARQGLFIRWDAQGNRVFEWWLEGEAQLYSVIKTPDGFAALGERVDSEENWELVTFGEDGVKRGVVPLGGKAILSWGSGSLALLPDGSLAAIKKEDGDVRMVIVPKEDVP